MAIHDPAGVPKVLANNPAKFFDCFLSLKGPDMLLESSTRILPSDLRKSTLTRRLQDCRASIDPLDDWRGHLPISGYYPCAGRDWSPILADLTDTWVYADYAPQGSEDPRQGIGDWLRTPPDGLVLESLLDDVPPDALSSWAPWPFLPNFTAALRPPIELAQVPFAMLAVYRRDDGRKVRLMYVIGEATATLMAIYGQLRYTPMVLALIQMGYGLGGGWNRFFDPGVHDCSMRHFFRYHPMGMPPLILNNRYMPPDEFPVLKSIGVNSFEKFELRSTHNDYRPREVDVGMLYDLFPWLRNGNSISKDTDLGKIAAIPRYYKL